MKKEKVMETETLVAKPRRGRKKGQEVKVNYSLIEDDILDPYKIYFDSSCYSVVDKFTKDNTPEKAYGFFTSLEHALKRIAIMKLASDKKFTLTSFITEYKEMLEQFSKKIDV